MKTLILFTILIILSCSESKTTKSVNISEVTGEEVFNGDSFYAVKFKVDTTEYIVVNSKADGSVAIIKHK